MTGGEFHLVVESDVAPIRKVDIEKLIDDQSQRLHFMMRVVFLYHVQNDPGIHPLRFSSDQCFPARRKVLICLKQVVER